MLFRGIIDNKTKTMNVSFWIARRYFSSRKKTSFVSLISNISMLGVGVGTMALVVVLSVFNGLEDMNRQIFKSADADIKITPTEGKRFELNKQQLKAIRQTPGIKIVTQVIEENALARYGDQQTVVRLKGVDSTFLDRHQLDKAIIDGKLQFFANNEPKAVIGALIQYRLRLMPEDLLTPLELWYPRKAKTLNFNSPSAFNQQYIRVSGVYSLEDRIDDYVLVPLNFASQLLDYGKQRTALEIQLSPETNPDNIKKILQSQLGKVFKVQTRDEQNANLLRAIQIEKLFVTVALGLIILVAAINIFFSLTMLVLDKRDDIKMLLAMGSTRQLVKRIFLFEGAIVAFTGAAIGLALGVLLCWLQGHYGFITMQLNSAISNAYPVKMQWLDFVVTGLIVVLITMVVSYIPASRAAQTPETR
jgi:lipoprotein-releasing system permease protein